MHMDVYQTITVDHAEITKDVNNKVVTSDEIFKKSKKFLNTLLNANFEVLESTNDAYGLPSQLLVGGDNGLPIKDTVYMMAEQAGLSKYIGHGEVYMQIQKK
jgi:hypothetical protein